MTEEILIRIRAWFARYCRTFYTSDENDQHNIILKEEHTHNVCANMLRLGSAERLDEERLLLAEVIGLLHDVGRFEQYRQYRTFRDAVSVDHAALGAEIIREIDLLADLYPHERDIVVHSIEYHNAFSIPRDITGDYRYFLELVRDADKLDIWRVFIEYYRLPLDARSSVVGLDLPDVPECTPEIVEKVAQKETVRLSSVRTLNDFKLLQLSWMYDLNFPESFRMVVERDCVGGIAETLPDERGVVEAVATVQRFVAEKMSMVLPLSKSML